MYLYFKIDNRIIRVDVSFEEACDTVEVIADKEPPYKTELYYNEDGELAFRYYDKEILVRDARTSSMDVIRAKIKEGKPLLPEELMLAIICDGVENVRFSDQLTVPEPDSHCMSSHPRKRDCVCKLDLERLSMPHEICKIKLKPSEPVTACPERFYATDFVRRLREGRVKVLESLKDKRSANEHLADYFSAVARPIVRYHRVSGSVL